MSIRKLKRGRKKGKKVAILEEVQQLFALALDHKAQGRLELAAAYFRRVLAHNGQHGAALNNLANILHEQGKISEALSFYQSACAAMPDNPEAHYNYGTALYEAGQIDAAIAALKQAITLSPEYAEAYASLGVACQAKGDLEAAQAYLEQAILLKPNYQEAHRFLGLVLKDRGDLKGALRTFAKMLQAHPEDAFTRYLLSRYTKFSSDEEAATADILAQLANPATVVDDAIFLHFALGKIFDDLKQYDKAFHHYQLANTKKRATLNMAAVSSGIKLGRIKKVFRPSLFKRFQGVESDLPVFIVGMPRSGTTLVEQICASHSKVHGAGELKLIRQLIDNNLMQATLPYPECLESINPARMNKLAESYLHTLQGKCGAEISRFTDKMPTNFIELGLIRILFPNSRIIHCVRDPLDTCLSNYFQNFEEGNECSFDLEELALYFRKYQDLMHFWRDTLPGGIFEIRYEDLVADCEQQCRRLIDYLGLSWEQECLNFFKIRRMVHTSSDWQVRQPIYSSSLKRWKNYESHLQPLRQALASESLLV